LRGYCEQKSPFAAQRDLKRRANATTVSRLGASAPAKRVLGKSDPLWAEYSVDEICGANVI
jgi:hypothetical protein